MTTMLAARLHEAGKPFSLDQLPIPAPRPTDVLVAVRACNVVPNLNNVLHNYPTWFPFLPLPKLPAIFGLDVAGEIAAVGSQVRHVKVGERVYVNPGRTCGSCKQCRSAFPAGCDSFTLQGYFGMGPGSAIVFEDYPYGGLAEYMIAPASAIVKLPQNVSFDAGARFGYIGTAYAALRKANAGPGTSVIITGATGTLGIGAVLLALAMGVTQIFAVARNQDLLARARRLDPHRIKTLPPGESIDPWVRGHTDGGADILIEALSTGAPVSVHMDAFRSLRRGGRVVCIGGMNETLPFDPIWVMCSELSWIGSCWFTTAEGEDMAAMAAAGTLDLSHYEHKRFALEDVNRALGSLEERSGGFTNFIVAPRL